jgi:transcriptional regulator with XRE-family HTH domain
MAIDRAHLASRLRTSMLERGLSQAELARQSGVDAARLNKIVHGKRWAEAWEIGALAYVLELELDDLLGYADALARVTCERDEMRNEFEILSEEVKRLSVELLTQNRAAQAAEHKYSRLRLAVDHERAEMDAENRDLASKLREAIQDRVLAESEAERLRGELEAREVFASSKEQSSTSKNTWHTFEELEAELEKQGSGAKRGSKVERPPIFQVFPNESTAMEHDVAIQRARLVGQVVGIGAAVLTLLLDSKSGLR